MMSDDSKRRWQSEDHSMSMRAASIPPGEALLIQSLVTPTEQGIASRVLARTAGGNLRLFAFDAGQELNEQTAPFDAIGRRENRWPFSANHFMRVVWSSL